MSNYHEIVIIKWWNATYLEVIHVFSFFNSLDISLRYPFNLVDLSKRLHVLTNTSFLCLWEKESLTLVVSRVLINIAPTWKFLPNVNKQSGIIPIEILYWFCSLLLSSENESLEIIGMNWRNCRRTVIKIPT